MSLVSRWFSVARVFLSFPKFFSFFCPRPPVAVVWVFLSHVVLTPFFFPLFRSFPPVTVVRVFFAGHSFRLSLLPFFGGRTQNSPRRTKPCTCCLRPIGKLGINGHVKKVMEFYLNLCCFFACLTHKQNSFFSGIKGFVPKTPKILGVFFWQTVTASAAYILSALLFKGFINVVILQGWFATD